MTNENTSSQPQPGTTGRQGNDKAPGEDPAGNPGTGNNVNLKGKKTDADLTQEQDRPADKEEEA